MRLQRLLRASRVTCQALLALPVLFVAACSVTPPRAPPADVSEVLWRQHVEDLGALETWSFSGRAALSGDDVPSRTIRILWQQQSPQRYDIAFSSLIGQRVAELGSDPDGVELRLPGEPPVTAATSRDLLTAALGWSAPVESLRHWVIGLPDPEARAWRELDSWGRLGRLEQDGWHVEYMQYTEVGGLALPRRLTVTHPGIRIRLVIDRWVQGQADARD